MGKLYNKYTFKEYPPTEILDTSYYTKSRKSLSFQYRDKDGDNLLGFIALKKDNIPISIQEKVCYNKGCRILMVDVRKIITKDNWQVKDYNLINAILEDMEFYLIGWCDTENNNEFEFDYFWFDLNDFKDNDGAEIMERIDGTKQIDSYVYKIIERH